MRRLLFAIAAMLLAAPALATPRPLVSVISTSVDEGVTATVRAKRTGDLGRSSSVIFSTSNATAVGGTNYTTRSGSLTFAPGASLSSSALVPTIRDGHVTPNLYFIVRLGVVSNATIQANGTVTVRNIDQPPPPPPPVQCPDGSTVPAGQTCPTPTPTVQWGPAPLRGGNFAQVTVARPWDVTRAGRPLQVGEIVAIYVGGWQFTSDGQNAYSLHVLSDGADGQAYAADLAGLAPINGNTPVLPADWFVGGLATATRTCADAFGRAGLPGVTQGVAYRTAMLIGTHKVLASGQAGWAGASWVAVPADNPYLGPAAVVPGDCLIGQ